MITDPIATILLTLLVLGIVYIFIKTLVPKILWNKTEKDLYKALIKESWVKGSDRYTSVNYHLISKTEYFRETTYYHVQLTDAEGKPLLNSYTSSSPLGVLYEELEGKEFKYKRSEDLRQEKSTINLIIHKSQT